VSIEAYQSNARFKYDRSATKILLRDGLENGKFLSRFFDDVFSVTIFMMSLCNFFKFYNVIGLVNF